MLCPSKCHIVCNTVLYNWQCHKETWLSNCQTLMSAILERPLNFITHSLSNCQKCVVVYSFSCNAIRLCQNETLVKALIKDPLFCRQIQIYFIEWESLCFNSNVTEFTQRCACIQAPNYYLKWMMAELNDAYMCHSASMSCWLRGLNLATVE